MINLSEIKLRNQARARIIAVLKKRGTTRVVYLRPPPWEIPTQTPTATIIEILPSTSTTTSTYVSYRIR